MVSKYFGFISYAHADATDLVEELDKYLTKHTVGFETVYDGHIPEGEKLDKILEKLQLCDIMILIITHDALESPAIKKEIQLAREKNQKIIPCKLKYVRKNWEELPWDISEFKGFIFENKYELRRLVLHSLDKILNELEKDQKDKTSMLFSETKSEQKSVMPFLQLDLNNNIYQYNDKIICNIINFNTKSHNPMKLVILDDSRKIIFEKSIPIKNDDNIYVEEIPLLGEQWLSKDSNSYLVVLEHEGTKVRAPFYLAYFGVAIELDQKVYTWTDKVYITVIAPSLNKNPQMIDRIGRDKNSWLIIKTRDNKIDGYELNETGFDTGIFTGEIQLTGFSDYDGKGDGKIEEFMGKTSGHGSYDGLLGCKDDDGIQVILKVNDVLYYGAALIRWNIGEVQWDKPEYKIGNTGTIVVVDPDVNLNPNGIDFLPIRIWSDSDPIGVTLTAIESGNATGIFYVDIQFGDKTSQSSLKVCSGDSVTAEYIDRTLPNPYATGHSLKISSTSIIS